MKALGRENIDEVIKLSEDYKETSRSNISFPTAECPYFAKPAISSSLTSYHQKPKCTEAAQKPEPSLRNIEQKCSLFQHHLHHPHKSSLPRHPLRHRISKKFKKPQSSNNTAPPLQQDPRALTVLTPTPTTITMVDPWSSMPAPGMNLPSSSASAK
jgi:hypothetical protein